MIPMIRNWRASHNGLGRAATCLKSNATAGHRFAKAGFELQLEARFAELLAAVQRLVRLDHR